MPFIIDLANSALRDRRHQKTLVESIVRHAFRIQAGPVERNGFRNSFCRFVATKKVLQFLPNLIFGTRGKKKGGEDDQQEREPAEGARGGATVISHSS